MTVVVIWDVAIFSRLKYWKFLQNFLFRVLMKLEILILIYLGDKTESFNDFIMLIYDAQLKDESF